MRNTSVVLLFVSLFIFSSANSSCGPDKKSIFFANGMFNDRAGASQSLIYIWSSYSKKYPQSKIATYEIAFNTSESGLSELFQVYKQKAKESSLSFWRSFSYILDRMGTEDKANFFRRILSEEFAQDQDLKIQIEAYKKRIDAGIKVITVAHSQGNFYTLFSFTELNSESTRMVSVATPASYVYGEGQYFTFLSDGVIKYIPNALAPNIKKDQPGLFDHQFLADYMKDEKASAKILATLFEEVESSRYEGRQSLNPADGYFNSDMNQSLQWANAIIYDKRKLSPGECILAESILSVSGLHGRTCEKRDFATLELSVKDCGKPDTKEGGETNCPFYRGMDFGNPYKDFYSLEARDFYQNHDECALTYNDFLKIKNSGSAEAVKILNTLKPK